MLKYKPIKRNYHIECSSNFLFPILFVYILKYVLKTEVVNIRSTIVKNLKKLHIKKERFMIGYLPSNFFKIVFLVPKYKGHLFESAIAIDDSENPRIDYQNKHKIKILNHFMI